MLSTSGLRLLVLGLMGTACALADASNPTEDLPQAVQTQIARCFPNAKILAVARDSKRNDYVYYTVQLVAAGKQERITFNELGEVAPPGAR